MQNVQRLITIILLGVCSALSAHDAKAPDATPRFVVTSLTPSLSMIAGEGGFTGGNMALLSGPDGHVLIDDSMPPFLDQLQAVVLTTTGQSLDFLINTHVHGDHIGNNASFGAEGVHIVAHDKLRTHLLEKGMRGANGQVPAPKEALPVITYTDTMTFHLNGETVRLLHVPRAHTDADTMVYFTRANVLHMGDVFFNGLFPFIDLASGGSVDGYIAAMRQALAMVDDATQIIPGHGPLARKAALRKTLDMLVQTDQIVGKLVDQGLNEDQIVERKPLQAFHDDWNWGFITTEKMTRQLVQSRLAPRP